MATWQCELCKKEFFDPEGNGIPHDIWTSKTITVEEQEYWLGVGEPICGGCAIQRGIPPVE